MVFVESHQDVAEAYIIEGLRRLWAASVDENGISVNFDYEFHHCPVKGTTHYIPYEDVYCPDILQTEIINDLLNEDYYTPTGKIYKLNRTRYEQQIRCNCVLGASPWSCKRTFLDKHPKFKEIEKKFD